MGAFEKKRGGGARNSRSSLLLGRIAPVSRSHSVAARVAPGEKGLVYGTRYRFFFGFALFPGTYIGPSEGAF